MYSSFRIPGFWSSATGCTFTIAGTVTLVSGEELSALRKRLARFDRVGSATGGPQSVNIDRLSAELSVPKPDLDAIETVLRDDGLAASAEACRLLLEAKDDELEPPVCPACPACGGEMKRHSGKRPKTFATRVGPTTVERNYCHFSGCGKGLYPLDAWPGLKGRSLTPGTELKIMATSAEIGSRCGSRLVAELSGVAISRSRFDCETRTLGAEVVGFERNDVPEASEGPVQSVVAVDGTGVPMRKSEHAGRAGKREDGTASTRQAKLLRICGIGRTPKGKVVTVAGSITQSSMFDSVEVSGAGSLSNFASRLWREAARSGSFLTQEIVLISDGAKWIENAAKTVFAGKNLALILDLYHVQEQLQEALKAMIPDEAELKTAFDRLKALVKDGKATAVIAELAPFADRFEAVMEFVRYCRSNLHRMSHDKYRRRGLLVGSGVIVGGCKHIVADRLKKSGSRWSFAGADGSMATRCCRLNNRTADFFEWRAAT